MKDSEVQHHHVHISPLTLSLLQYRESFQDASYAMHCVEKFLEFPGQTIVNGIVSSWVLFCKPSCGQDICALLPFMN